MQLPQCHSASCHMDKDKRTFQKDYITTKPYFHILYLKNVTHTGLCVGVCVCVFACMCMQACVCMLIRWRLFAVPPYIFLSRCALWVTDNSVWEKTVTSRICASNATAGKPFFFLQLPLQLLFCNYRVDFTKTAFREIFRKCSFALNVSNLITLFMILSW